MRLRLNLTLAAFVVLVLTLGVSTSRAASASAPAHKSAHFLPSRFTISEKQMLSLGEQMYSGNDVWWYFPLYCSETGDGTLLVSLAEPGSAKTIDLEFTPTLTRSEFNRVHESYPPALATFLYLVSVGERAVPEELTSRKTTPHAGVGRRYAADLALDDYECMRGFTMRRILREGRLLRVTSLGRGYLVFKVAVDRRAPPGKYYVAMARFDWTDALSSGSEAEVVANQNLQVEVR